MAYFFPHYPLISIDSKVCTGKPHIKGTRITVAAILAHMAGGMTVQKILEEFPRLTEAAVSQALAFASSQLEDQYFPLESAV